MKDELNVYEYTIGEGLKTYINTSTNPTPIHPDYLKPMNDEFKVGDLVETYTGKVAIIKTIASQYEEGPIHIAGANNTQYVLLVGDVEMVFVGYSLKKL